MCYHTTYVEKCLCIVVFQDSGLLMQESKQGLLFPHQVLENCLRLEMLIGLRMTAAEGEEEVLGILLRQSASKMIEWYKGTTPPFGAKGAARAMDCNQSDEDCVNAASRIEQARQMGKARSKFIALYYYRVFSAQVIVTQTVYSALVLLLQLRHSPGTKHTLLISSISSVNSFIALSEGNSILLEQVCLYGLKRIRFVRATASA